ncbi:MAG: DNA primase, partial [Firmicutes bacterium]|nr:DNA primase [Bacillota bacterium]
MRCIKSPGDFFYSCLNSEEGQNAREYMEKRGITERIAVKFGLGYSPGAGGRLFEQLKAAGFSEYEIEKSGLCLRSRKGAGFYDRFRNRLMFPIIDVRGRVSGFGGRSLDGKEPKYLNSPETAVFSKSTMLFGLNFAKDSRRREIIVVEGYMDMISLYQAGFTNTAAVLGTAMNERHVNTLKRIADSVILLYDSDEAGERAAQRAIPIAKKGGLKVRALRVRGAKDPDEFIKKYGRNEFARLLAGAEDHMFFRMELLFEKYDLNDPEHKLLLAEEGASLLISEKDLIARDIYIKEFAQRADISEGALHAEIKKREGAERKKFERQTLNQQNTAYYKQGAVAVERESDGIKQAARELLYLSARDKNCFKAISSAISPEEFPGETFPKAAKFIFEKAAA